MRFNQAPRTLRRSSPEKREVLPDPTTIDFEKATPEQFRAYVEAQESRKIGFRQDPDTIQSIEEAVAEAKAIFAERYPKDTF